MSLDSYNNRKINIDSDSKVFRAGIVMMIMGIAGEKALLFYLSVSWSVRVE